MKMTHQKNRSVCLSLPTNLVNLLDKVRTQRQDPTRSATARILILRALAEMSYLPPIQKKALGLGDMKNE